MKELDDLIRARYEKDVVEKEKMVKVAEALDNLKTDDLEILNQALGEGLKSDEAINLIMEKKAAMDPMKGVPDATRQMMSLMDNWGRQIAVRSFLMKEAQQHPTESLFKLAAAKVENIKTPMDSIIAVSELVNITGIDKEAALFSEKAAQIHPAEEVAYTGAKPWRDVAKKGLEAVETYKSKLKGTMPERKVEQYVQSTRSPWTLATKKQLRGPSSARALKSQTEYSTRFHTGGMKRHLEEMKQQNLKQLLEKTRLSFPGETYGGSLVPVKGKWPKISSVEKVAFTPGFAPSAEQLLKAFVSMPAGEKLKGAGRLSDMLGAYLSSSGEGIGRAAAGAGGKLNEGVQALLNAMQTAGKGVRETAAGLGGRGAGALSGMGRGAGIGAAAGGTFGGILGGLRSTRSPGLRGILEQMGIMRAPSRLKNILAGIGIGGAGGGAIGAGAQKYLAPEVQKYLQSIPDINLAGMGRMM